VSLIAAAALRLGSMVRADRASMGLTIFAAAMTLLVRSPWLYGGSAGAGGGGGGGGVSWRRRHLMAATAGTRCC
jgi:hypothetical protein